MDVSCGFIIRHKDDLFVVHPTNMNHWSIPKGVADDNEDYIDAAKRELQEETSLIYDELDIKFVKVHGVVSYLKHKDLFLIEVVLNKKFDVDFLECNSYYRNRKTNIMEKEVDRFKWIKFNSYNKILNISLVDVFDRLYRRNM
jgi:predicted NUDIX family NTP pyrophosphohydrolase